MMTLYIHTDTIVALQALATYEGHLRQGTLNVKAVVTASNFTHTFNITDNNKLLEPYEPMPTLPTTVSINMTGQGCAVLQSAPAKTATTEEYRISYKASTDSPLPHAGDEEVTGGDVGEREGEVVGDTTPTYGERRFSDFSLPHQLPACQQEQQMPVLSPHPP
ncbi:hypothetical protein Pcinc_002350 [Petrolisthes cinctipes]|uniref:Uncharacterized protein n=1 Tax=Petrolisthes cinctipes TaxID=88211 RepID=A0AAE1L334_PETCI|nr:hypothetical protein Pcinc_002350 [Petrolisthes cinctipes]